MRLAVRIGTSVLISSLFTTLVAALLAGLTFLVIGDAGDAVRIAGRLAWLTFRMGLIASLIGAAPLWHLLGKRATVAIMLAISAGLGVVFGSTLGIYILFIDTPYSQIFWAVLFVSLFTSYAVVDSWVSRRYAP